MSLQECLVLIAYLNFVIVPKTKHENRISVKTDGFLKPHRVEKVGRSTTHSRAKLKELLAQESVCADQCENVKAGGLKPHRVEKVGRSTTHSRAKLKELLVDTRENNGSDESNEWDTGPAVGNEIMDAVSDKIEAIIWGE